VGVCGGWGFGVYVGVVGVGVGLYCALLSSGKFSDNSTTKRVESRNPIFMVSTMLACGNRWELHPLYIAILACIDQSCTGCRCHSRSIFYLFKLDGKF
jgi:hypothetical protein